MNASSVVTEPPVSVLSPAPRAAWAAVLDSDPGATALQTPEYFAPFHRWAGILFAIFSVVGYGSVAALGVAMLRADLGPAWLRWTTLVWGLTGGFVVGYNVPFIMYVPMLAWGVVLLRM